MHDMQDTNTGAFQEDKQPAAALQERGLKVIVDFRARRTADHHRWHEEAQARLPGHCRSIAESAYTLGRARAHLGMYAEAEADLDCAAAVTEEASFATIGRPEGLKSFLQEEASRVERTEVGRTSATAVKPMGRQKKNLDIRAAAPGETQAAGPEEVRPSPPLHPLPDPARHPAGGEARAAGARQGRAAGQGQAGGRGGGGEEEDTQAEVPRGGGEGGAGGRGAG